MQSNTQKAKLRVAYTGGAGLIGTRLGELLKDDFALLPISRHDLDISDQKSVSNCLEALEFDILIHLAAYTNVDGAEVEKDLAYSINVTGTKNVHESVVKKGKKMIYISTDFVFDGTNPPYDEKSVPNPLGYYSKTKFEGELIVQGDQMIVRTSYPYGYASLVRPDLVAKIRSLLESGKSIPMMQDAKITPTFIDDIIFSLKYLINNFKSEIFHVVGSESLSPYELGLLIANKYDLDQALITPMTYAEYTKGTTKRPQYSEIISTKNTFYPMKRFKSGLSLL